MLMPTFKIQIRIYMLKLPQNDSYPKKLFYILKYITIQIKLFSYHIMVVVQLFELVFSQHVWLYDRILPIFCYNFIKLI